MTVARSRAFLLATAAAAGIPALLVTGCSRREHGPSITEQHAKLLLLTSLPLLFGDDFSLSDNGSAAAKRLQSRYELLPINVTSRAELAKGRLLLMAQPRAQPAEDLVELDSWVRQGGRLLLLADPMLEWPSRQPLGDVTRPPAMFMDTGLLAHWGLQLHPPSARGRVLRRLGGRDIATVSPGTISGSCSIGADGLVAHCRIGAGAVTVVADADLLDTRQLGSEARTNMDALIEELVLLDRDSVRPQTYPQSSVGNEERTADLGRR